jgi:ferredoxin, 2Fe-2S
MSETITITTRQGAQLSLEATRGMSLMEIVRFGAGDELMALCGGGLTCGTCHVYIAEADFPRLPPMAEDEFDLLDALPNRRASSRLACQVTFEPALDGLALEIPR